MGEVRTWFLRDVLALAERERGAGAMAFVSSAFPERVRQSCSKQVLQDSGPTATVPTADAEEFLSAIDGKLGDGTGKFLEELGTELTSRTLSQTGGSVIVGDLHGTLARLRVPFEHPFVDMRISYEVTRTPGGLCLEVGALGHPRLTRILRHLATGSVHAAQRFARCQAPQFRVHGETRGERARIDVLLYTDSAPPESAATESAPPRRSTRPLSVPIKQSSLSEEVDAIFSRRTPHVTPTPSAPSRRVSPTGYSVQDPEHGELESTPPDRPRRATTPPGARPRSNPYPMAGTRRSEPALAGREAPERTTVRPTLKSAPPTVDAGQQQPAASKARRRTKPY